MRISLPLTALALGLALSPLASHAAPDMFLKIPGVEGESTDAKHAREIEVLSWSWGASNSGGTAGGGGTGKVVFQDLHITKLIDKATPKLMLAACAGQHLTEAVLVCRRPGDSRFEYLTITLSDVMVTSISSSASSGDPQPSETMSLNFTKVKFDYVPQNSDGSAGTPVSFGWDVAANKPL